MDAERSRQMLAALADKEYEQRKDSCFGSEQGEWASERLLEILQRVHPEGDHKWPIKQTPPRFVPWAS